MSVANINAYFKAAMSYPIERLAAVMQGKDNSIPQAAAMMALQIKKPMIDAMKGQQAQQQPQPPSVKDQMEQEVAMLPENVGIMNLPAPNMEQMDAPGMADGGIVAFDAGGMTKAEKEELAQRERKYWSDLWQSTKDYVRGMGETISNTPWESSSPMIKYKTPKHTGIFEYEQAPQKLERLRAEDPSYAPPVSQAYPDEFLRGTAAGIKPGTEQFVDARTPPPAGDKKPAAPKDSAAGIAALPTLSKFQVGEGGNFDAELARLKKYMPDGEGRYTALAARYKEDTDRMNKAYEEGMPKEKAQEGLERMLQAEAEKDAGKKDRSFNMALINAGLAMMGGKSQYALQNISEGALQGTRQYTEDIKELEKAERERGRLQATIEEARRAEARGDYKEKYAREMEAVKIMRDLEAKGIDAGIKGATEAVRFATDRTNTKDTVNSADRRAQLQSETTLRAQAMGDASAERRAAMQAEAYKGMSSRDPYNIAYDNAMNKLKAEFVANPGLKAELLSNPEKYNQKFNQYLQEALAKTSGGGVFGPAADLSGWGSLTVK